MQNTTANINDLTPLSAFLSVDKLITTARMKLINKGPQRSQSRRATVPLKERRRERTMLQTGYYFAIGKHHVASLHGDIEQITLRTEKR
jgi:hypothetical protein